MNSTFTEWKTEGPQLTADEVEQFRCELDMAICQLIAMRKAERKRDALRDERDGR
jgi:hypothetical protein